MSARSPQHLGLGRAVRELRSGLGYSQEGFAHASGLDRTYLGSIERGERNPTFEILLELADALGVKPSALLARGEQLS